MVLTSLLAIFACLAPASPAAPANLALTVRLKPDTAKVNAEQRPSRAAAGCRGPADAHPPSIHVARPRRPFSSQAYTKDGPLKDYVVAGFSRPADAYALSVQATAGLLSREITVERASEVVVVLKARCAGCNWGEAGREAATLRISIDGAYSQHLVLTQSQAVGDYPIVVGALTAGRHRLTVERDATLSASGAGTVTVEIGSVRALSAGSDDFTALSMAPILYARPNTVGRFTDVPLLMWYEVASTTRGRRFRYSVIFTNEDGGTATDRLMATWGRTTDIEFVYGVELDSSGKVLAEEFQGPGHDVPPFKGRHEGRHPLLWVSTDNNMVSEAGTTNVRYAPAPERFDLTNVSREVVMDRHPWSYMVAAQEMQREGKIDAKAAPGAGRIPDLRLFVFIEACTELEGDAALAFSVRVGDGAASGWCDSDRGLPEFRIVRGGCFRGAVPLPASAGKPEAVRFRAYSRKPQEGKAAVPGRVTLTRVNKIFTLGEGYLPRDSTFSWTGSVVLPVDGEWVEPR
jgi:hypothetical protein